MVKSEIIDKLVERLASQAYNITKRDETKYFYRLGVVSIYAIWEGFMHNFLESYIKYINSLELEITNTNVNMLTFYFDSYLDMKSPRVQHNTKKELTKNILHMSKNKLLFDLGKDKDLVNKLLKSNVNYKILENIFLCLSLDISSVAAYQDLLNKLLNFRNKISHGENAIVVNKEEVSSFIEMIENIMLDIVIIVENAVESKSYCEDQVPVICS